MKFGFVTRLQDHISLSDNLIPDYSHYSPQLRLNQQSFYRYRKRQLVPTDRYRGRYIGKLIGSVSVDRVAYRYLDAFPYMIHMCPCSEQNHIQSTGQNATILGHIEWKWKLSFTKTNKWMECMSIPNLKEYNFFQTSSLCQKRKILSHWNTSQYHAKNVRHS